MLLADNIRRIGIAVTTGAMCALVVTACGGGSSAPAAPKDNGIASQTPTQIVAAVKSAMEKQHSFHVAGSGTSDGEQFGIDLNIDVAHDSASGFLSNAGQRIDLVRIGTQVFVKASADFYKSEGLPAAAAALLDGRWIKSTTANKDFASLTDFTSLDGILTPDGAVTKGEQTTINGQKVLGLVDSKGTKDEGTLYVQTTGDPLVVREAPGGGDTGNIDFDDYGKPLTIIAPSGAVDFSQVTGG